MSSKLNEVLQRLQNRGETDLATELESLIEATASDQTSEEDRIPVSRRFLAQAAHEIRQGRLDVGHDYVGAAIEAFRTESKNETVTVPQTVLAELDSGKLDAAPSSSFMFPMPDDLGQSPEFASAEDEVVHAFANVLLSGGYTDEAKAYLTGHAHQISTEGDETMKSDRQTLEKLQAKFKKDGNVAMAKAVNEIIADLEEGSEEMEVKEDEAKGEGSEDGSGSEDAPAPEAKPVLEVEPPAKEEEEAKTEASAALKTGDLKKAKACLAKAQKLERLRIVAALIKAGDMELAMEGLEEDQEGQGGYAAEDAPEVKPVEEPKAEEVPEEAKQVADADKPAEEPKAEEGSEEKPAELPPVGETPAPASDEEVAASKLEAAVKQAVESKNMPRAKKGVETLAKLESRVVAGVKKAEQELKDEALASEGYSIWAKVRKAHLTAQVIVAEAEGDKETCEKAMEAMEKLDGDENLDETLDQGKEAQSVELTTAPVLPQGGVEEAEDFDIGLDLGDDEAVEESGSEEGSEEGSKEGSSEEGSEKGSGSDEAGEKSSEEGSGEEADAMKYECLQSLEEIKGMKADRNGLAFTFWADSTGKNPYWTVQANGKPIAEIHLNDQENSTEIRAFFSDEGKYPQAVAQSVENVGLYEMLKGVKARFYANEIHKSSLVKSLREKAVADVAETRVEKLADLRRDFVDAISVAAEALNKGLMKKPNTLKAAFVKTLASYGIHNPALVVEAAFAEGFNPFVDQVIADAQEYLEMPKDAFAHAKRMILSAENVAHAQASQLFDGTLGQRLQQNSLPLGSVPATQEAPALESEVQASLRQTSEREKNMGLRKKLRLSVK